MRSLASGVRYGGRFSFPFRIFSMVLFRSPAVKGGAPVSMSYISAPRDHQSTAFPWPERRRISGAIYSIVPQNVCVTECSSMDSLQRPKSVSLTCPFASNRMFSGFRSLQKKKKEKDKYWNRLAGWLLLYEWRGLEGGG